MSENIRAKFLNREDYLRFIRAMIKQRYDSLYRFARAIPGINRQNLYEFFSRKRPHRKEEAKILKALNLRKIDEITIEEIT